MTFNIVHNTSNCEGTVVEMYHDPTGATPDLTLITFVAPIEFARGLGQEYLEGLLSEVDSKPSESRTCICLACHAVGIIE